MALLNVSADKLFKTSLVILVCALSVLIQLEDNFLENFFGYAGYTLIDGDFGVPDWVNVSKLLDVHVVNFEDLAGVGLDERLPTLIKQSPVKEWEALKKWNPDYLTKLMPVLTKAKFTLTGNNVFVYEDNNRMMRLWDDEKYKEYEKQHIKPPEERANIDVAGMGTVTLSSRSVEDPIKFKGIGKRMLELHNMSTADFFATNNTVQWNSLLNSQLGSEAMPRDFMYVVDDPESTPTLADFTSNIWVNSVGATTGMHYDPNHNMFAQVYGCKRFVLVSPQYWNQLKLHPLFHPSDRQSQLEFKSKGYDGKVNAQIVDLYPGDLLYLPPHYFHRVTAIKCDEANFSISVNVFSNSRAKALSDLIQNTEEVPIYFVEPGYFPNPDLNLLVGALGLYIRTLVSEVTDLSVKDMIEHSIVQERYMAQGKLSSALGCKDFEAAKCPSILVNSEEFIKANDTIAETVQSQAKEKAKVFNDSNLPRNILDMILADTIERIVTLVVSLEKACSCLRCIAVKS
mmetsp:Transcript_1815/g.2418  ORF Transcript_1815/g.2418 Transcript_1815/m.2418 type:complete len:513 (-) Transcript_1815:441-1979(-)